jgi:alpha-2-macroglobulin
VDVAGSRGQAARQKVEKYDRTELVNLAELTSGDLVEVELEIDSKNDYEYLVFEDLKAAGFEPVDLRSGYTGNALGAYVEFRDERTAFFVRQLPRGKHSISYRLRAEIPGQFSALPAKAAAMYAPELRGNSDEIKLRIVDRQQ